MRGLYPWLYIDYKENLWRFSVNENKELNYRIMYTEGKWTKETLIDSKVIGFGLFIDDGEGIHIVYSNTKGELRYCTMKESKWVGKVLYKVEDKKYIVESIKIKIIGNNMHIFYSLASEDGSDHGILMHCIWDGNKTNISKLEDIILKANLKEYYLININSKNEIYLFYLSDEGDELSLNYLIYKNNDWLPSNRLYGIQGEEVYFDVEIDRNNIHVLNKSKENLYYFLDHVIIDSSGSSKYFRVYEGKNNINEPLILNIYNKTYSFWIENNEIYYSIFLDGNWQTVKKYTRDNNFKIEKCKAYISEIKEGNIEGKSIYSTTGLDMYIYDPKDLIINDKQENSNLIKNTNSNDFNNEEIEKIKFEILRVKEENKDLEDKLYNLNALLQKSQKGVEKYNQQLARALEKKRKAEENSDIFLELQKKIQEENEILANKNIKLNQENDFIKSENENLNLVLQKNKEVLENYEQELVKVLEQKQEVEKNRGILLEVQKKVLIENEALENENSKLSEENNILKNDKENLRSLISMHIEEIELLKNEIKNINIDLSGKDIKIEELNNYILELKDEISILKKDKEKIEFKIKEYIGEISLLKDKINNINNELLIKDKKAKEENDLKTSYISQLEKSVEENLLIKRELALLIEENDRLITELEIEKNKSVMEKILRKRT